MKRPLIVRPCALPPSLALSLPRDASESMWWKIQTANKWFCALPGGPDSLEAELSILASLFFQNPESLRVILFVDTEQRRDKPGALLSIEGFWQ